MSVALAALAMAGAAAYLGFWIGVRRERGRAALIAEIETERKEIRGVRLRPMKVRR
jgi:cytochrome oxidase assembly protein ShyY1